MSRRRQRLTAAQRRARAMVKVTAPIAAVMIASSILLWSIAVPAGYSGHHLNPVIDVLFVMSMAATGMGAIFTYMTTSLLFDI